MKHIAFIVIASFACAAWAQAPKEPAKEAVKEAAKPEAVKETAKPEVAKPEKQAAAVPASTGPRKARRWNEDARHCLELPSNTEIIKCAEELF